MLNVIKHQLSRHPKIKETYHALHWKQHIWSDWLNTPGGHPKSPTCGHLKIPHLVAVFKA